MAKMANGGIDMDAFTSVENGEEPIKKEEEKLGGEDPIANPPKEEAAPKDDFVPSGDGDDLTGIFKEEKKEEEGKETVKAEVTEDTFKLEGEAKTEEKSDELKLEEIPQFNYEEAAKELGLELGEKKDQAEFIAATKAKIESAKEVKELDLSKYDEQSKQFINYLEKGGTLKDFVEPLKRFDDFISLNTEDKLAAMWKAEGMKDEEIKEALQSEEIAEKELREYYADVEGKRKSEINDLIDNLISDDKLLSTHKETLSKMYTEDVKAMREEKFKEILSESDKKVLSLRDKDQSIVQEERKNLVQALKETTEYKGLKLPDNVVSDIEKKIENGEFFQTLNNAKAQINAYLDLRFREQIEKAIDKKVSEASRKGYNSGIDKKTQKLHNSPTIDMPSTHERQDKRSGLEKAGASMEDGAF